MRVIYTELVHYQRNMYTKLIYKECLHIYQQRNHIYNFTGFNNHENLTHICIYMHTYRPCTLISLHTFEA